MSTTMAFLITGRVFSYLKEGKPLVRTPNFLVNDFSEEVMVAEWEFMEL